MKLDFNRQTVLVTGASRGIGRSIALGFGAAGATVLVHYRQGGDAANETLALLPKGGHVTLQADLADPQAVEKLVAKAAGVTGRIDVLVNNAGVFEEHPPTELDYAGWQRAWSRTLGANLLGPANLSFLVARRMIDWGGGRIVNVSSRGAFRGEPDAPAYGASKAGLNALSQSLAKALAPYGIHVYAVAPGWVETDMAAASLAGPGGDEVRAQSPLNRAAKPEEIARAVLFLAAEGGEYLTGCILDANGASYLRT